MTTQDSTYGSPADAHERDDEPDQETTGRHVGEEDGTTDPEVAEAGPTLLPVDTEADGDDDSAVYDADAAHDEEAHDDERDEEIVSTPATPGAEAAPLADDAATSTPFQGFGHEPSADVPAADAGAEPAVVTSAPAPTGASATEASGTWRELQSHFVDDPADAVRQAGELVEQALADLRSQLESGDTENLRTAFRRYRDLHAGLI